MENDSKLRLLAIHKILYDKTDDDNPLSTAELIEILDKEYGIPTHRTTISKDIAVLKSFGCDIVTIESTKNKYFVAQRVFELPELKLLIDAVESSKFITERKSIELPAKLERLTSENQAHELKRNLSTGGRIKPGNEKIYYIIDAINEAINRNRKISFQYFQYNVQKVRELKNNGELYVFSPHSLVWYGDYYYVVGFSEKHGGVCVFRVDRIAETPHICNEEADPMPEGFEIADFIKMNLRMYNSVPETVELICDNDVMDAIVDYFGEEVDTFPNDENTFRAIVNVSVSHIFYSWLFGFNGKVKILSPESVKEEFTKRLRNLLDDLEET